MELRLHVVLLILAMAVVTLLPRLFPFLALSRVRPPPWVREWLTQVPVAVLAALVVVEMLGSEHGAIGGVGLMLVAMVPVALIAAWRGSFLVSVLVGVAAVAVLRLVGA